ncbi:MAG TPA: hypothetical protein VG711_12200 [Phycisphaerales bacterium]|nr:hypothetical protein [Phycisphaerales bacterium]
MSLPTLADSILSCVSSRSVRAMTAVFVISSSIASQAHAQLFDPPAASSPSALSAPKLEKDSYAYASIATLKKELDALLQSIDASGADSPAIRAQANLRAIAIAMLESATTDDPASNWTAIQAFTLIDALPALDKAIQDAAASSAQAGVQSPTSPIALLNQFNADAANLPQLPLKPPMSSPKPTILNRMFNALFTAINQSDAHPRWPAGTMNVASAPSSSEVQSPIYSPSSETDSPPTSAQVESLRTKVATSNISSDARTAATRILSNIQLALSDADLAPRTAPLFRATQSAIELADYFAGESILPADRQSFYSARLSNLLTSLVDPANRPQAYESLARLSHSASVLQSIHDIASRSIDPAPLLAALAQADGSDTAATTLPSNLATIQQFSAALSPLLDSPPNDPPSKLKRDLLEVRHKLALQLSTAQAKLIQAIPRFATDPSALADPAIASMIQDTSTLALTINNVDRIPSDVHRVSEIPGIRVKTTSSIEDRLTRHARLLLEPAHQQEAAAALNNFHDQLSRFAKLPAEDQLASPTPAILSITAGLQRDLANAITSIRIDWLDSWATGQSNTPQAQTALTKMDALFNLMSAINDLAPVLAIPTDAPTHPLNVLNRHPAWHLSPSAIARLSTDPLSRLKLAVAAAVQRNDAELHNQLEQVSDDAPILILASHLAPMITGDIREPASDTTASQALEKLCAMPTDSSALLSLTPPLARLTRYQLELEYALPHSSVQQSTQLQAFVTSLARSMLQSLNTSTPSTSTGNSNSQ